MLSKRTIRLFSLSFLFFCLLCSGQPTVGRASPTFFLNLMVEDKKWLDKFMRDIMLDEDCIYTLWGTKPITTIDVYYLTEEQRAVINEANSKQENKCYTYNVDLTENWEKFKETKNSFPLFRYLLFEKVLEDELRIHRVYFVNIMETARVLHENYPLFVKVSGMEFDPIEIVYDMEKETTPFWGKVLNNSLTLGILYGYGKENATYFSWIRKDTEDKQVLTLLYSIQPKFQEHYLHYGYSSISHFPLPQFASYFLHDPVVKKYEEERKAIQKVYKGKDFLDLTLTKLTE